MKIPIVFDETNPKFMLLNAIFIIIDSREAKQELARNGIKPANSFIKAMKIRFISMFFDVDNKYVINEINNSPELRKRFRIKSVLDYNKFSKDLSVVESEKILEFVLKLINKQFIKSKRGKRTVIIDATPIILDINLNKKYYADEELEEKGFKKGFSKTHGSYIGYKLTLAIDFHTGQPLAILMHKGAYHDSKIYLEMLEELKNRRIIGAKDIIMTDKGYVSYNNYERGLMDYKIIPFIFPRENMRLDKILGCFNYPLEVFKGHVKLKRVLEDIVSTFKIFITHWKLFKPIRACIEHFFKFMKEGVSYSIYHAYTDESIKKTAYLNVLLVSIVISKVKFDMKTIQRLSEI